MGLPTPNDNQAAYKHVDIAKRSENIWDKRYMLIHGNADFLMNYYQTMLLAITLQRRNNFFKHVIYPGVETELYVQPYFYRTMDNFWTECFNLDSTVISS